GGQGPCWFGCWKRRAGPVMPSASIPNSLNHLRSKSSALRCLGGLFEFFSRPVHPAATLAARPAAEHRLLQGIGPAQNGSYRLTARTRDAQLKRKHLSQQLLEHANLLIS